MGRISGSFRDPSGYVFQHHGRIFRALDPAATQLLQELEDRGHLARWTQDGLIVGTRSVTDSSLQAELAADHRGFAAFLEHDRIEPITYPYEWSASMLADAGRLTLRLQGNCSSSASRSRMPPPTTSNSSAAGLCSLISLPSRNQHGWTCGLHSVNSTACFSIPCSW